MLRMGLTGGIATTLESSNILTGNQIFPCGRAWRKPTRGSMTSIWRARREDQDQYEELLQHGEPITVEISSRYSPFQAIAQRENTSRLIPICPLEIAGGCSGSL